MLSLPRLAMFVRVALVHFGELVEGPGVEKTFYVVSTRAQSLAAADVYLRRWPCSPTVMGMQRLGPFGRLYAWHMQRGPCYPMAVGAQRLGSFGKLFAGHAARWVEDPFSRDSDGVLCALYPRATLFWFYQNYGGGVDCYVLPHPRPSDPAVYVHYHVRDIEHPCHWFRATDYHFVGFTRRPEWAIPAIPRRPSTP